MHKRNTYKVLARNPKKKFLGIDEKILKQVLKKQGVRMWTHLAQDRDGWCAFVNFVNNSST